MSPFCICQSCAFCSYCTQELGKWESDEDHTCEYYIFMDDYHLKMNNEEREKAYKEWYDAGGEWEGVNDFYGG